MQRRTLLYVIAVGLCAVLVNGALFLISPVVSAADVRAAFLMAVVGIIALKMMYRLPRSGTGSIAFIPFLAAAIVTASWVAALAASLAILASEIGRRPAPIKALFNISQTSLAIAVATIAFRLAGGHPLLTSPSTPLLEGARTNAFPILLLIGSFFVLNTVLVAGVIAASEGGNVLHIWRKNTVATVPYDLLSAPVVYLFAWVYVGFGITGTIAVCIPLIGVRQLYKTNSQLEQINQELLELMVKAIEARDPYTSGHSRRVAHYSSLIARAIGLSGQQVERVRIVALLHDVGKIHEIYAPLLQKPEKLTPAEWSIMQGHPIKSAELVMTVSHLADIVSPVRHHHENWDGSGYPDGLAGEEIPLASRIVLFADTIDAMTTDRPYRRALSEHQVRAEFVKHRGKQFDPEICDRLLASPMFGLLFSPNQRVLTPPSAVRASRPQRKLTAM